MNFELKVNCPFHWFCGGSGFFNSITRKDDNTFCLAKELKFLAIFVTFFSCDFWNFDLRRNWNYWENQEGWTKFLLVAAEKFTTEDGDGGGRKFREREGWWWRLESCCEMKVIVVAGKLLEEEDGVSTWVNNSLWVPKIVYKTQ